MSAPHSSDLPPHHTWESMAQFLASSVLEDGVHHIAMGAPGGRSTSIEFRMRSHPGTALAVHFYGAQSHRRPGDTPIFKGYRTSENLNCSYLLFHDPSLSLSHRIGLGWYEGFRGFAASTHITAVITHVARVVNAPRTVLWGGSAGGYAALRNAASVPNGVAFVWNPQASILRYRPHPVRRYARVAFGTDRLEHAAGDDSGHVVDLTVQPVPNWTSVPVVYLQEADDSHVRDHLSYLLRDRFPELSEDVTLRDTLHGLVTPNFYLHQSPWKPGHAAPPQPVIEEFLRTLVNTDTPILEILEKMSEQSSYLLHRTRESFRPPLHTELASPITPSPDSVHVLQWGSRFGQYVVSEASTRAPISVRRNILGQSLVAAYTNRTQRAPKSTLITHRAHDYEHWRMMLGDQRASARSAISDDAKIQVVVKDLLDELRGVVNVGNYSIFTNHRLIRRDDRGPMVRHTFGETKHRRLWRDRLSRLNDALAQSDARLLVIDVDATELTAEDWAWLGIHEPPTAALEAWHTLMADAHAILSEAVWITAPTGATPLRDRAPHVGARVAEVLTTLAGAESST